MNEKWSTLQYDMGEVKEGSQIEGVFTYTDPEVNIVSAAGSCGCTVSSWKNEPLKQVSFIYSAPSLGNQEQRKVSKSILVKLSDGSSQPLTIIGKLVK